jgi:hypothetical protein
MDYSEEILLAEEALRTAKIRFTEAKNTFKVQALGEFIGCKTAVDLLQQYTKLDKIGRTEKRKLSRQKDQWVNGDMLNALTKINGFDQWSYEFALTKILRTLEFIEGSIDSDEWGDSF